MSYDDLSQSMCCPMEPGMQHSMTAGGRWGGRKPGGCATSDRGTLSRLPAELGGLGRHLYGRQCWDLRERCIAGSKEEGEEEEEEEGRQPSALCIDIRWC